MNTTGTILRFTDFGESHGPAVGGVLDGVPSGITIDMSHIQAELARRRTGASTLTSQRHEDDRVTILSGLMDGVTLGTPIAFYIANTDARSSDYANLATTYRPNHADYTYQAKYGIRDHRGGGRASARETAARVVAGAIAQQVLGTLGVTVTSRAVRVGNTSDESLFEDELRRARNERDTCGAVIEGIVRGLPAGVGEPIFGKLQARLAEAMMSINAAKGFEYGDGFAAASQPGSLQIDNFYYDEHTGQVRTRTNHSGGIQGGISNGADIVFRVAFKPIATMARPVETIDADGNSVILEVHGRHDPCVWPRVLPVVDAMTALTILDALLVSRAR